MRGVESGEVVWSLGKWCGVWGSGGERSREESSGSSKGWAGKRKLVQFGDSDEVTRKKS